ncbi:uncharacterized protein LOC119662289 [Teleopsis dalmanni]|uniref:uncharacterized protein LOC119662289 n=1 Tax=Teleopsis dalmanni TaxID=139649 RepID=UPI0018CFACF8|nr:uncharacterized protein LOC119662289 [Teleopsis dalmanni]
MLRLHIWLVCTALYLSQQQFFAFAAAGVVDAADAADAADVVDAANTNATATTEIFTFESVDYNYNKKNLEGYQLKEFLKHIEELVLNTTDRALLVTRNVYLELRKEMSLPLQHATSAMMQQYINAVNQALEASANYTEKRKLFQIFRSNNRHIEQLRQHLDPLQPTYQFQLISNDFYNSGINTTEFDNLYLEFMGEFQCASEKLWSTLEEQTVEQQEELLEILDEISNEKQLREKDKLYDEFIEMYLFKNNTDLIMEGKDLLY